MPFTANTSSTDPTITVTGTETDLTGLADASLSSIVTVTDFGNFIRYDVGEYRIQLNNAHLKWNSDDEQLLFNPDANRRNPMITVPEGSTLEIGEEYNREAPEGSSAGADESVVSYSSGCGLFCAVNDTDFDAEYRINLYGLIYCLGGNLKLRGGIIMSSRGVGFYMPKLSGQNNAQQETRNYAGTLDIIGTTFINLSDSRREFRFHQKGDETNSSAFDGSSISIINDGFEISQRSLPDGFSPEIKSGAVVQLARGSTSATLKDIVVINNTERNYDLASDDFTDTVKTFTVTNSDAGSDTRFMPKKLGSSGAIIPRQRGICIIQARFTFNFKNPEGEFKEDIKVYANDISSGEVTNFRKEGNGINFLADRHYTSSSDSVGNSTIDFIIAVTNIDQSDVDFEYSDWDTENHDNNYKVDRRGNDGTTEDLVTFFLWSYLDLPSEVTLSGKTDSDVVTNWVMFPNTDITETDYDTVGAYTQLETNEKRYDFQKWWLTEHHDTNGLEWDLFSIGGDYGSLNINIASVYHTGQAYKQGNVVHFDAEDGFGDTIWEATRNLSADDNDSFDAISSTNQNGVWRNVFLGTAFEDSHLEHHIFLYSGTNIYMAVDNDQITGDFITTGDSNLEHHSLDHARIEGDIVHLERSTQNLSNIEVDGRQVLMKSTTGNLTESSIETSETGDFIDISTDSGSIENSVFHTTTLKFDSGAGADLHACTINCNTINSDTKGDADGDKTTYRDITARIAGNLNVTGTRGIEISNSSLIRETDALNTGISISTPSNTIADSIIRLDSITLGDTTTTDTEMNTSGGSNNVSAISVSNATPVTNSLPSELTYAEIATAIPENRTPHILRGILNSAVLNIVVSGSEDVWYCISRETNVTNLTAINKTGTGTGRLIIVEDTQPETHTSERVTDNVTLGDGVFREPLRPAPDQQNSRLELNYSDVPQGGEVTIYKGITSTASLVTSMSKASDNNSILRFTNNTSGETINNQTFAHQNNLTGDYTAIINGPTHRTRIFTFNVPVNTDTVDNNPVIHTINLPSPVELSSDVYDLNAPLGENGDSEAVIASTLTSNNRLSFEINNCTEADKPTQEMMPRMFLKSKNTQNYNKALFLFELTVNNTVLTNSSNFERDVIVFTSAGVDVFNIAVFDSDNEVGQQFLMGVEILLSLDGAKSDDPWQVRNIPTTLLSTGEKHVVSLPRVTSVTTARMNTIRNEIVETIETETDKSPVIARFDVNAEFNGDGIRTSIKAVPDLVTFLENNNVHEILLGSSFTMPTNTDIAFGATWVGETRRPVINVNNHNLRSFKYREVGLTGVMLGAEEFFSEDTEFDNFEGINGTHYRPIVDTIKPSDGCDLELIEPTGHDGRFTINCEDLTELSRINIFKASAYLITLHNVGNNVHIFIEAPNSNIIIDNTVTGDFSSTITLVTDGTVTENGSITPEIIRTSPEDQEDNAPLIAKFFPQAQTEGNGFQTAVKTLTALEALFVSHNIHTVLFEGNFQFPAGTDIGYGATFTGQTHDVEIDLNNSNLRAFKYNDIGLTGEMELGTNNVGAKFQSDDTRFRNLIGINGTHEDATFIGFHRPTNGCEFIVNGTLTKTGVLEIDGALISEATTPLASSLTYNDVHSSSVVLKNIPSTATVFIDCPNSNVTIEDSVHADANITLVCNGTITGDETKATVVRTTAESSGAGITAEQATQIADASVYSKIAVAQTMPKEDA